MKRIYRTEKRYRRKRAQTRYSGMQIILNRENNDYANGLRPSSFK